MKSIKKILLFVILIASLITVLPSFSNNLQVSGQDSINQRLQELSNEIERYQAEIARLQSEANTLRNQIAQYDAQIRLTQLKIAETEEKILLLGGRIDLIQTSIESLTEAFNNRANRTYKMVRLGKPILMIVTADDLSDIVSSFHYLQKIQEADKDLLDRLGAAQTTYKEEKEEQEDLQLQLEEQKSALDVQKAAKSNLLLITRNDEKRYQELLAAARAEFEAIQAIIAGKGDESEVGPINEGEVIASVIPGASCNSSGMHLHFIVSENGNTQNPFSHLRGGVDYENCSGSSCESGDGDPFNPSGSWNWPISPKIKFSQGYGSTWAVRNTWVGRIYQFHNGIDINNESVADVRAVKAGTLFRGSYTGYNGCRLRYVRVDHDDSNLDTYYLHINY
jgi:peptidoglycan hydrolase CwlO-like protein